MARTNDRVLIARGVLVGWVALLAFSRVMQPFNRDVMGTRVLDWLIVKEGSDDDRAGLSRAVPAIVDR